jgi:multidrug efflux pump subunit AcrA (membrane-fusion protein)
LPDLSAAVDIETARTDNVVVVPRDAVAIDRGAATIRIHDGGTVRSRTVTLGAMNDHQVIVASGLEPGTVIERHVAR